MAMTDHTIRYFSSTTDRPLSCDVCGQLISRDGFLHQRRTLSINVLILVTEGTLYLTANGIPYTVPPNHYIFLHEGEEISDTGLPPAAFPISGCIFSRLRRFVPLLTLFPARTPPTFSRNTESWCLRAGSSRSFAA